MLWSFSFLSQSTTVNKWISHLACPIICFNKLALNLTLFYANLPLTFRSRSMRFIFNIVDK